MSCIQIYTHENGIVYPGFNSYVYIKALWLSNEPNTETNPSIFLKMYQCNTSIITFHEIKSPHPYYICLFNNSSSRFTSI